LEILWLHPRFGVGRLTLVLDGDLGAGFYIILTIHGSGGFHVDGAVVTILALASKGLVVVILVDITFLNVYAARLEARIAGLCAELGLLFYPGFCGAVGGGLAELDQ
jgi:hypothetical protein